jgi:predicted nucleic acid-binding protein
MIVVSDTTAVTTLLKAGMEGLLRELFGSVIIPQAVWDELNAFHSQLPDFVLLRALARPGSRLPGTASLGLGEAEAITLAKEVNADLLLTDDLKARGVAARLNVKSIGLLGLLIRAKQRGYVPSVRDAIGTLQRQGGLYLSEAVKAEALRLAGELP